MLPLRGDDLNVDEPTGQRWLAALDILREGGYVVCWGLGLTFRSQEPGAPPGTALDETLHVRVESQWEPPNVTAAQAEEQLRNAEAGIAELRHRSPEFDDLVKGRVIDYELIHTYGMGAIRLALLNQEGFSFVYKR